MTSTGIKVGGITPLTTIDFPGHLSAVIYLQGCPWRCRYCHNGPLLNPGEETDIGPDQVLDFLKRRRGLLDGVVFSGGEPTYWRGLPDYIASIREIGYNVALHTNGAFPDQLDRLLKDGLLDWVAMDVKAPFDQYRKINRIPGSGQEAKKSVQKLLDSSVQVEFRTTVHPDLLSREDILNLAEVLSSMGAKRYVLQKCRMEHSLDPELRREHFDFDSFFNELRPSLQALFPSIDTR